MTTFTVDIDASGISYAREQYNARIQVPKGESLEMQPGYLPDDAAYVQFVMNSAAESYKKQALASGIKAVTEKAIEDGLSVVEVSAALVKG